MRYLTAFLALFLATFFLVPGALGSIEWVDNCTDGFFWRNATICIGGTCSELTQPPVFCDDGCAENGRMCNSVSNVPNEYIPLVSFMFLFTAALSIYLSSKMLMREDITETGKYISWMMVTLGLILILVSMGLLGSFFNAKPDNISGIVNIGYIAFTFVLFLFLVLFLVNFLFGYLKNAKIEKGYR